MKNKFLVSGPLLGILFCYLVYGMAILDPANIQWLLHGDPASHYLGFAFFRNADWGWPLGHISQLGHPLGSSVVYTDSIPLLAIVFKLFRGMLPEDFQYFGLWYFICYCLQGYYSERLLRGLGVRGLPLLAGTLLLVASPALALRAYGHESLMAHWLLLAAFDASLRGATHRLGLLLAVSAWIHPYFVPMLGLIAITTWWRSGRFWSHALPWGAVLAVMVDAAGYFSGNVTSRAAEGYGYYSANLATFFDPMNWREFLHFHGRSVEHAGEWSRLLPALGQATHGQYEGFAYLGAGVLLLLLITPVATWRVESSRAVIRTLGPLLLVSAVLFVYALSSRITVAEAILLDVELPARLQHLLGVFRATGRFVWPLALILTVLAIVLVNAALPLRRAALLLLVAVGVQIWDLSDKRQEFQYRFSAGNLGWRPEYRNDVWSRVKNYRNIVVLPAVPDGDDWIAPALFAARHGQTINVVYSARTDSEAVRQEESRHRENLMHGRLAPDTAYLVRDRKWILPLQQALQGQAEWIDSPEGMFVFPR